MKNLFLFTLLFITPLVSAAEQAFIKDDISVWSRTGPSNAYKVKYKLYPGTQFEIIQRNEETGFVEVRESNQRVSWIDPQFVTMTPTAHVALVSARSEISRLNQTHEQKLDGLQKRINELEPLESINQELQSKLAVVETDLEQARQKAQLYESGFKKDAYFTGAAIILSGMFIGWILSRLGGTKRNSGWN